MSTVKTRLFFKSLFSRYSLAFFVIIFVAFFLLVAIIDVVLGQYYMENRRKELGRLASSGSTLVMLDYRWVKDYSGDEAWLKNNENKEWLWTSIATLHNETDMFIFLTDADGMVLHAPDSSVVGSFISPEVRDSLLAEGEKSGISDSGVFDKELYYYGEVIYDHTDGTPFAVLYACIPMSFVRKPVASIMRLIVLICFCVMLGAVLVAYFISEKITAPLAKMSRAAKAFADGDFSVRVPVRGGSEISDFAQVFNSMADSLENMDKTRNDFVANVSHDLRSPMTSITGFIDGMLTGVIPPEKHQYYMRIVLGETKRLSRLVATLLDISKIQAGERKFRMMNFDICEMARQIIISFENRIEEKSLQVNFESDADRIFVSADMDAIYQVLYNLCDNATKFAFDGGKFEVTVLEKNSDVEILVFNEGNGIAEEDLGQVFDRFYKADKSRGMDKSGTGLGLYISKKIIEAHRQKISVKSDYGKSCCFSFTLSKGEKPARGRGFERMQPK